MRRGGARNVVRKVAVTTSEATCQTDEVWTLAELVTDAEVAATSSTKIAVKLDDLSKEQLVLRLKFANAVQRRQAAQLRANQTTRTKQSKLINELLHLVKIAVQDHRQAVIFLKDVILSESSAFANIKLDLQSLLTDAKEHITGQQKDLKNALARNEAIVEKSKAAVDNVKSTIEQLVAENNDLVKRNDALAKARLVVHKTNVELRERQNAEFITTEALCPKCKAVRNVLNEITEELRKAHSNLARSEADSKAARERITNLEQNYKALQVTCNRLRIEKDTYKDQNNLIMEKQRVIRRIFDRTTDLDSAAAGIKLLDSLAENTISSESPSTMTASPQILNGKNKASPMPIAGSPLPKKSKPSGPPVGSQPPPAKKPPPLDMVYIIETPPSARSPATDSPATNSHPRAPLRPQVARSISPRPPRHSMPSMNLLSPTRARHSFAGPPRGPSSLMQPTVKPPSYTDMSKYEWPSEKPQPPIPLRQVQRPTSTYGPPGVGPPPQQPAGYGSALGGWRQPSHAPTQSQSWRPRWQ